MKRIADLLGPSPYTGEQSQTADDNALEDKSMQMPDIKPDYTVAPEKPAEEFNWSMSGTHVQVSEDDHGQQFQALEWSNFDRPHAYGKLELFSNWKAYWHVYYTNLSPHIVEKRLKRYTKDQGWEFGSVLDESGAPYQLRSLKQASYPGIGEINPGLKDWKRDEWSGTDQFDNPADNQSDFYGESDPTDDESLDGLYNCSECGAPCMGYNDLRNHMMRTHINPGRKPPLDPQPVVDLDDALPANFNEAIMDSTIQRQSSSLLRRLAASGTPRKATPRGKWYFHVADGRERDSIMTTGLDPTQSMGFVPGNVEQTFFWDDIEMARKWVEYYLREDRDNAEKGFDDWLKPYDIWAVFEPEEVHVDPWWERDPAEMDEFDRGFMHERGPASHLTPHPVSPGDLEIIETHYPDGRVDRHNQHFGASANQPMIQGPIPFIYDIETDRIFVGHPGERHSDIQGRFTPGGIVEGLFDPKGNIQIRTDTDMPYTVRHMAELWYALHPELEIKGIYLLQGEKKYRLASSNIAYQVRSLVATEPAAWAVFQALEPYGNVYAVGGAVRDVVLGKTPKDIDLMVQGIAADQVEEILEQLPGRVDLTGESFGVFRYRDPEGNDVEVALPRTERSTGPGHRDFEVYTDPWISVEEDLGRRDFTSNAMAVNLGTGELVDPYHGSEALKSGVLEPVSDRSFVEDPLRILRAFTSVSRHGLLPSDAAHRDLAEHAHTLSELPQERLQMELDKIMSGSDPSKAIDLMEQTGVLQHVLPDVAATYGYDQKNKHHNYPLNDHLKLVLENAAKLTDDVDVRWAALLHDIGKPASQWIGDDGTAHYYQNERGEGQQHEEVGAQMAKQLLTDLKFPTDRIDKIVHLVRNHMFPTFSSTAGARKFINKVGDEHADSLLQLRQADIGGKGMHDLGYVPLMQQYVNRVRDAGEATDRSQLAINGGDLINAGFAPGPQMGQILEYLTQAVLEDPSLNDKQKLLQMALESQGDVKFSPKTLHSGAKQGNVLDPIRDELDPTVFNHSDAVDPDVKPKVIQWVKKKIYTTMLDEGWPDPSKYLGLYLTGSLTTYQWSGESDFDTSLWVDVDTFPEFARAELIRLMIEKCDGTIVPGTTHPIQCFVVDPVRFTKDDLYQPGLRSAYDLDEQRWFVLPEKERSIDVAKRWPEHIRYAKMVTDKMKMMLRYENNEAVKIYWNFLHRQRFLDMRAGKGDYSLSNIVYKMLANEGLFPFISEATGEHIASWRREHIA